MGTDENEKSPNKFWIENGYFLTGEVDDGQGGRRRSQIDLSDCFRIYNPKPDLFGNKDGYGNLNM